MSVIRVRELISGLRLFRSWDSGLWWYIWIVGYVEGYLRVIICWCVKCYFISLLVIRYGYLECSRYVRCGRYFIVIVYSGNSIIIIGVRISLIVCLVGSLSYS